MSASRLQSPDPTPALPEAASEVSARVAEARRAQALWAARSLRERLRLLERFRHLAAAEVESLAEASARPRGRPPAETLTAEALPLLEACRFLERAAPRLLAPRRWGWRGRPLWLWGCAAEVVREPLGVILVLGPSNYPLFLPGVQVLQALAAGNAVVLKPGLGGVPAANALVYLLHQAGLPPALCPVLDETPAAGEAALCTGVDKVLLTGSVATGRAVLAQLADSLTPATLELSGVDAVLVRADADVALAARAVAFGLRLNAGATCIAPRRLVVHRAVAPALRERLVAELAAQPTFPVPAASLGALAQQLTATLGNTARLLAGRVNPGAEWQGPLVLEVREGSALWRTDWFGPLALWAEVTDDAAALRLANDSPFALGAVIFTRDPAAARPLARALRAGTVTFNDLIIPTADPRLPFGGRGASGFGVTRGAEGLLELTAPKVIQLRRGRWRPHYDPLRPGLDRLAAALARVLHGQGWATRARALGDLLRGQRQRRHAESAGPQVPRRAHDFRTLHPSTPSP